MVRLSRGSRFKFSIFSFETVYRKLCLIIERFLVTIQRGQKSGNGTTHKDFIHLFIIFIEVMNCH